MRNLMIPALCLALFLAAFTAALETEASSPNYIHLDSGSYTMTLDGQVIPFTVDGDTLTIDGDDHDAMYDDGDACYGDKHHYRPLFFFKEDQTGHTASGQAFPWGWGDI